MQRFCRAFALVWTLVACLALRVGPALGIFGQRRLGAALWVPLAGVVLAVVPIPGQVPASRDLKRGLHWAGLLMLMLFVVLASASFGLIFLPSVIASFVVFP
jgi:hypothetical protein